MHKPLFIILVFISFSAMALETKTLFQNISNSIDSVLWDTVNEGDMKATVAENNGLPDMQCDLSIASGNEEKTAICEVFFDVESYYSGETEYCSQSCTVNLSYNAETFNILEITSDSEQKCLETLSSGCN